MEVDGYNTWSLGSPSSPLQVRSMMGEEVEHHHHPPQGVPATVVAPVHVYETLPIIISIQTGHLNQTRKHSLVKTAEHVLREKAVPVFKPTWLGLAGINPYAPLNGVPGTGIEPVTNGSVGQMEVQPSYSHAPGQGDQALAVTAPNAQEGKQSSQSSNCKRSNRFQTKEGKPTMALEQIARQLDSVLDPNQRISDQVRSAMCKMRWMLLILFLREWQPWAKT